MAVSTFGPGGYRFIEGVFQYSAGVAAERGYAVERARFSRPVPLAEGFAAVEAHLAGIGRPIAAFCACELRSPEPFTEQGFVDFNRLYVGTLERWGIIVEGANPVARTNVCPEVDNPAQPSLHAFSYTVPSDDRRSGFIVAGSGEAREGAATYRESIIRFGDTSQDALREKMRFVMDTMTARLAELGVGWADAVLPQVYTVHDIGELALEEIVRRGAAPNGFVWHYCRPPVEHIEYEMDVLGPARVIHL